MQIAIIENGNIVQVGDHRQLFPNVSFPPTGPDAEWMQQNGVAPVVAYKTHDPASACLIAAEPHLVDGVVYTVSVREFSQHEISSLENAAWNNIRIARNHLLRESDWTQLPDAMLTAEQRQLWLEYRQALRDVTQQTDIHNLVWPIAPSAK